MDWIGALLMVLAVAFLVGIYISQPFLRRLAVPLKKRKQDSDEIERQRSTLLAERDRILTSLQDLEFDHTLGKVPEEDFPQQRLVFLEEGAEVLRQLDELEPPEVQPRQSAEDRLEAAVAARRADAKGNGNGAASVAATVVTRRRQLANGHDDVEKMVDARRLGRPEKAAGFCPHCGKPVQRSDKFCSRCGTVIE
jgi:hypothetical protein